MSAPKPRVRVVPSTTGGAWFQWSCPCDNEGLPPGIVRAPRVVNFTHADALEQAIEHSRTHTAERVAEHLEACSSEHRREGWSFRNTPMMRSYWLGRDSSTRYAARLIRQHLVKERP